MKVHNEHDAQPLGLFSMLNLYNIQNNNPIYFIPSTGEKMLKISVVLYNWTTTDRMVRGLSLSNRLKRAENTPGL